MNEIYSVKDLNLGRVSYHYTVAGAVGAILKFVSDDLRVVLSRPGIAAVVAEIGVGESKNVVSRVIVTNIQINP